MAFKFVILAATLAYANAGFLGASVAAPAVAYGGLAAPALAYSAPLAAPAITSQHSNIIRSFGNLGQVSTYSKSIDTPFSSVRKADIRVSNPGLRTVAAAPALAYAAPAVTSYHSVAAPAISSYHGIAAPAIAAPVLRTAVAAPAIAAPVLRTAVAAPAIAAHPAIGVAYSAAPAVSHLTYASTYANYGW